MQKILRSSGAIAGMIALLGLSSGAHAFDIGYQRPLSDKFFNFQFEAVLEGYYRNIEVPSETVFNAVNATEGDKPLFLSAETMGGKLSVYNLMLRPTIHLGGKLTAFVDFGIFDDVYTPTGPPLMLGGGGRLSQEIYPGVVGSLFATLHITERYRYEMEVGGDNNIFFNAEFEGRHYIGTGGAMISGDIRLEDVELFPYVGVENSLHRSNGVMNYLRVGETSQTDRHRTDKTYIFAFKEKDFLYLIAGLTLLRPNHSTMRFEFHYSPSDFSLTYAMGINF